MAHFVFQQLNWNSTDGKGSEVSPERIEGDIGDSLVCAGREGKGFTTCVVEGDNIHYYNSTTLSFYRHSKRQIVCSLFAGVGVTHQLSSRQSSIIIIWLLAGRQGGRKEGDPDRSTYETFKGTL